MTDTADRLRLARTDGVGPVTYRRLLHRFGTAAAALAALPAMARAGGRRNPLAIPSKDAAAREIDQLHRLGGQLLFVDTPAYPPLLARLDDAPAAISVLGDPSCLAAECLAVVGSRNASANGRRIAEDLAAGLTEAGLLVVSGMARGIDTAAHVGAMRVGGTIACVAGGLDKPYPFENARLQEQIAEAGAVVAEAPLGTAPQARHFPRRNRLIAGLSLGTLVVEAALRSGSLITARLAIEADREVFAVPGSPLDPRCRGTNDLLRQGAHLAEHADDVLAHLRLDDRRALSPIETRSGLAEPPPDSHMGPGEYAAAHAKLLDLLGPSPTAVDELIRRCQFSAAAVMSILLDLEIAGRVELLAGNRVALLAEPGQDWSEPDARGPSGG